MAKKNYRKTVRRSLGIERLEPRLALSVSYLADPALLPAQVEQLLIRASAAANTESAIIAVVDRNGDILGVRVESGVTFSSAAEEVFAIDGAVAEARTAALFSSDFPDGSPLSSRAIQFVSQSTITQREVDSSPESTNPTTAGPGIVGPIGVGGLFPPGISNTAVPDLFAIETTNRDTLMDPGRFNTPTYVPGFNALISYGQASGIMPSAQPRGIGTLPGGVPIYENNACVGGIGVFFPGPNGYASYEQNNLPGANQTQVQREMRRCAWRPNGWRSPPWAEAPAPAFRWAQSTAPPRFPARSIFPSCRGESAWEALRSMTLAPTEPISVPWR